MIFRILRKLYEQNTQGHLKAENSQERMIETIEQQILNNLIMNRIIGGKHTDVINLTKGFPKHTRGEVKKVVKKLLREQLLIRKLTSYGLQVSLDPKMLPEVFRRIEGK